MKLYEIFEGIKRVSIMSIADRVCSLNSKLKYGETICDADWNWLRLACENQSVLHSLSKAVSRYVSPTTNYNDLQSEMLNSGGTCAEAICILNDIKRDLDFEAETKMLQATDEIVNSEEMAQLAQQQAYIDLQNSYNQAANDSAEYVSKLANKAIDI